MCEVGGRGGGGGGGGGGGREERTSPEISKHASFFGREFKGKKKAADSQSLRSFSLMVWLAGASICKD